VPKFVCRDVPAVVVVVFVEQPVQVLFQTRRLGLYNLELSNKRRADPLALLLLSLWF
jgi:hypothetical protein